MLPPSVWPMVLGQQERGHERNPHTFTGLQAVGAGILTETVRDADEGRGGNVEEGGSSLEGGQRLQETLGVPVKVREAAVGRPVAEATAVSELDEAGLVEACLAGRPGDHILIMSNGGFGGIHDKLLARLSARGDAR